MTGIELKKAIKDSGWKQADVANVLGVSKQVLNARMSRQKIDSELVDKVLDIISRPMGYVSVGGDANNTNINSTYQRICVTKVVIVLQSSESASETIFRENNESRNSNGT